MSVGTPGPSNLRTATVAEMAATPQLRPGLAMPTAATVARVAMPRPVMVAMPTVRAWFVVALVCSLAGDVLLASFYVRGLRSRAERCS